MIFIRCGIVAGSFLRFPHELMQKGVRDRSRRVESIYFVVMDGSATFFATALRV